MPRAMQQEQHPPDLGPGLVYIPTFFYDLTIILDSMN
jgi:hypothetical protein